MRKGPDVIARYKLQQPIASPCLSSLLNGRSDYPLTSSRASCWVAGDQSAPSAGSTVGKSSKHRPKALWKVDRRSHRTCP